MADKIYSRNNLRFSNLQQQAKAKKVAKVIIILAIAFSVVYFSMHSISPIMQRQCKSMAKSIATKISNTEATKVMAKYDYDDLLTITKDKQGNIKMVGTNIITVNEIISDIPVHIQEELEKSENNSFSIRLGSFLGSNLFARKRAKCKYKNGNSRRFRNRLKVRIYLQWY